MLSFTNTAILLARHAPDAACFYHCIACFFIFPTLENHSGFPSKSDVCSVSKSSIVDAYLIEIACNVRGECTQDIVIGVFKDATS